MTIKEIIGDFRAYGVQQHLNKLQQIKAPAIICQKLAKQVADFKAGLFKVKGLARKYRVANVAVTAVYVADTQAHVYSTQTVGVGAAKEQFVQCKTTPTTVLRFETAQGVYYYDAANNQIGSDLIELDLATKPADFRLIPRFSK